MKNSKVYGCIIILVVLTSMVFVGCSVSEGINIPLVKTFKEDIYNSSELVKNVDVYYMRPSLWYYVSFIAEPSNEDFENIVAKIESFTTDENISQINKVTKSGLAIDAWIGIDINGDGLEDYRYYKRGNAEWHGFYIPRGNSNCNLIVGEGLVGVDNYSPSSIEVQNKEFLYYSNLKDGGKLYRVHDNGSLNNKVLDEPASNINVIGDYIYYKNQIGQICKVFKDGSKKSVLLNEKCLSFVMSGYNIYYILDGIPGIYLINNDGKQQVKLSNDDCYNLNILHEKYLFYIEKSAKNAITMLDIQTKEKKNLNYFATSLIVYDQGSIFYLNKADNDRLYLLRYDPFFPNENIENIKLSDNKIGGFSPGHGIFYENLSDNSYLYVMNWDGTENKRVIAEQCKDISIIYDSVYYLNNNDILVQFKYESNTTKQLY